MFCKGCKLDFPYLRKHLCQVQNCNDLYSKSELENLEKISNQKRLERRRYNRVKKLKKLGGCSSSKLNNKSEIILCNELSKINTKILVCQGCGKSFTTFSTFLKHLLNNMNCSSKYGEIEITDFESKISMTSALSLIYKIKFNNVWTKVANDLKQTPFRRDQLSSYNLMDAKVNGNLQNIKDDIIKTFSNSQIDKSTLIALNNRVREKHKECQKDILVFRKICKQ